MEEIKKLVETWKTEKGSFIPNAPIYGMFIKELEDAIEKQEQINKLTVPVVNQQRELLEAFVKQLKEDNELTEEITFQDINKCIASNCG